MMKLIDSCPSSILIIFLLSITPYCSYVQGLHCYVTYSNAPSYKLQEKLLLCEDLNVLPTVKQMNEVYKNDTINPDQKVYKKGKLACWKTGLEKGCAFVDSDLRMGCTKKIDQMTVEEDLKQLQSQKAATLPLKDCFCDANKCNTGSSQFKIEEIAIQFSMISAMITSLIGEIL